MRSRVKRPPSGEQRASGCPSVPILRNLSPLGLQDFDSIGFEANLPKGAILFRNGDLANSVALLCQGQAKLLSRSREGKVLILRVAIPGDLIGLGAVVSGGRHEFTAEIVEDAVVKKPSKE